MPETEVVEFDADLKTDMAVAIGEREADIEAAVREVVAWVKQYRFAASPTLCALEYLNGAIAVLNAGRDRLAAHQ